MPQEAGEFEQGQTEFMAGFDEMMFKIINVTFLKSAFIPIWRNFNCMGNVHDIFLNMNENVNSPKKAISVLLPMMWYWHKIKAWSQVNNSNMCLSRSSGDLRQWLKDSKSFRQYKYFENNKKKCLYLIRTWFKKKQIYRNILHHIDCELSYQFTM